MAQKLTAQGLKAKKAYNAKYAKENFKRKLMTFNVNFPEDMEIYDWISQQAEGGNKYIKNLVRQDMKLRKDELPDV